MTLIKRYTVDRELIEAEIKRVLSEFENNVDELPYIHLVVEENVPCFFVRYWIGTPKMVADKAAIVCYAPVLGKNPQDALYTRVAYMKESGLYERLDLAFPNCFPTKVSR